jgi:FkbM family methyltransferase
MIRLHVLGIPHTSSRKEFTVCAFTQKVINFCKMYKEQGMYVIHYGREDSQVICDEHVPVSSIELWEKVYGHNNWKEKGLIFDLSDEMYKTFTENSIREINKRKQPHDIVLSFFGYGHKAITDAFPDLIICEPSIGYSSAYAPFKVYESYAVMHGLQGPEKISNAEYKFYDVAIPSGFDLSEFQYTEEKQDYFLMVGRLVWSKGVNIAAQVCEKLGVKLVLAGTTYGPHDCHVGHEWPKHVEYVGYADVEKRKKLMAGAKGLFCPTIYNEPFGYVAIEAMLSGTPVISTDWGAFTETVQHGITGFRCRTFEQFVWAAKNIDTISPKACRDWAEKNYNMEKVGKMYTEYFQSLINVSDGSGWYAPNNSRTELEWLTKEYPENKKTFKQILNQYNRIKNGKVTFLQIGAMDGVKHDELYDYVNNNEWSGYLVEPLPDMFKRLTENYKDNPRLTFECSAITDKDGPIEMHRIPTHKIGTDVREWAEGCSTLVPENHIQDLREHMVTETVSGLTIKSLYQKYGISDKDINFIQVDTEGFDYNIFLQLHENGLTADIYKIEIAHITYNKSVWMRWVLDNKGYKTFIDGYDLIAYRF